MDNSLADIILEMGYNFTLSVENCRNALVHFGLQELKPSIIARMISAMIKTHSGLNENTHIYVNKHFIFSNFIFINIKYIQDSNGADIITNNEKNSLQTWNVDTFVLAINDLV
jgi:CCR4-NOT transcription complex subunit 1